MHKPVATVLFFNKKHKNHQEIIEDLSKNYNIKEHRIKDNNIKSCLDEQEISQQINSTDVLIVYLSDETKNSACICHAIKLAANKNIKVIGIWIENSDDSDMSECMESFGDAVTTYPSDIIKIISSNVPTWIDSDGNDSKKRKIKKHICG